ncbi:hypothetical protein [Streptococcus uberis]|uniref:hypothetical protein n=1 Tax=Streptococcus uberis TaxID=1349 RepID=UPI00193ADF60|nr:hypothetical protein [Streptococcus uberis]
MVKNQFPLVADDMPVIESGRQMNLYENEDLISNIHGFYQDKDYNDVTRDYQPTSQLQADSFNNGRKAVIDAGRSYAEEARKKARQDLKEKRQAYLSKELSYNPKQSFQKSKVENPAEQRTILRPENKWSRLTQKLGQDSYILAELPKQQPEPNTAADKKQAKNNYDFLKRSQIYNSQETRIQREKSIAQELNLTRLDGVN